jgi:dihydroflavonol-4-reductase
VVPLSWARRVTPLTELWARVTGSSPLFTRETVWILEQARPLSHARATQELGYRPRPIPETVADTVAWFREVGWLLTSTRPRGVPA